MGSQILSELNSENHKTAVIEMVIFKDNGKRYDNWSGKKKKTKPTKLSLTELMVKRRDIF